jgi:hypothetical protein
LYPSRWLAHDGRWDSSYYSGGFLVHNLLHTPHQSTAAPLMMSDEDKGKAERAKKAKEKQEKKEKDEAIKVFVNSVSLDDVIWDDNESKSILIGKSAQGEKKMKLQSIKGKHQKNLPVPVLKKLCTHFQIGGYKNADKADMCELIVKAAKTKNLKHQMYPSSNANTTNTNADGKKKSKKKGKKKSKATKPKCVTKEGTYYRAILTLGRLAHYMSSWI